MAGGEILFLVKVLYKYSRYKYSSLLALSGLSP